MPRADTTLTPSPGTTSPRSLNRGESLSQEGVLWPEVDGLNDADLDDEIEAFERSLRADWEVRPFVNLSKCPWNMQCAPYFKHRKSQHCLAQTPQLIDELLYSPQEVCWNMIDDSNQT